MSQLSPGEIAQFDKKPEEVLRRIQEGLQEVCRFLMAEPTYTPAWMLKGRYHLASMELAHATEAFRMAEACASRRRAEGLPDLLGTDNPSSEISICDQLKNYNGDRFAAGAELLQFSPVRPNAIAGAVLNYFKGQHSIRRNGMSLFPTGRVPKDAENVLRILTTNNDFAQISFGSGPESKSISIAKAGTLSNLSALTTLKPEKLRIRDAATLDWKTLAGLPLMELNLSDSRISSLPNFETGTGFARIKSFSLENNPVADISPVRSMVSLENLDLSGTQIKQLEPLAKCTKLRELNLGGLSCDDFRPLMALPLERLTISPDMFSNKTILAPLRSHTKLKILRAPKDPENQTPAEFWAKVDASKP